MMTAPQAEGRGIRRKAGVLLSILALVGLLATAGAALAQNGPATGECQVLDQGEDAAEVPILTAPSCIEGTLQSSPHVTLIPLELPAGGDRYAIVGSVDGESDLELCLLDSRQRRLQCRYEPLSAQLLDLAPVEGEQYFLHVRQGGTEEIPFRVELTAASPVVDELEPNDDLPQATALDGEEMRGRWLGDEFDYYTFEVDGDPQLWRFEVEGDGVSEIAYFDGSGRSVQRRGASEGPATMTNLFLLPGRHYVSARGMDSDYVVRAIPLGQPSEGTEREANDDETRAQALRPFEERRGTLDAGDGDYYRFTLYASEYVRIEVEPSTQASLNFYLDDRFNIAHDEPTSEALVYEALLLPGDHYLRIRSNEGAGGDYRVVVTPLDPLALPTDVEPNNQNYEARLLPPTGAVTGSMSRYDNVDWYRLPPIAAAATLAVEAQGSPRLIFYSFEGERSDQVASINAAEGSTAVELPAGDDIRVQVAGEGEYRLQFDLAGIGYEPVTGNELELVLDLDEQPVSAYWHEGQRLEGEVSARNIGDSVQHVELVAASSHYAWKPILPDSSFALAPGESRSVPIVIEVLPDARDDLATRVTVQARPLGSSAESPLAEAYFAGTGPTQTRSFRAECGAPLLMPATIWPVPTELLGGVNLAWQGLGGTIADRGAGGATFTLLDGLVAPSTGWHGRNGSFVTVELAATGPVAGVLLNGYANSRVGERLADFEIHASTDGENFEHVLSARMGAEAVEHAFVFPEPVTARFLRLVVLTNQWGQPAPIALGELKAVAVPTSLPLGRIDLAAPGAGGYVVWAKPQMPFSTGVWEEDLAPAEMRLDEGENTIEWALGFHNDRAARVASLEWVAAESDQLPLESVEVAVSLEGPIGPWTDIGTWQVQDGSVLELPDLPWVRFVRIRASELTSRETYALPAAVRVYEAPAGDGYLSAIGEWGQSKRDAVYEALVPRTVPVDLVESDENDTRERAQALDSGEIIQGRVVIGEDVDWYRISVPQGENSLELSLSADPVLTVRYELIDAAGNPVLYDVNGSASEVTLSAFVEPGDYYLVLDEPPRSVVFAWDNSGSMGPYLDIIYQTVSGFVRDVQPGREVAQLLAFEDKREGVFLLEDWSDQPLELMAALNNYGRTAGSSDAEINLYAATRLLGEREGTRAILLMTDAESPGYRLNPELWTELERVQPRIFTFETSSGGSTYTQDLMQSWADVAGGYYDYARGVGDFESGFSRATCHLRRPAQYRLETATEYREPPGPGLLSVARSEGVGGNPPVEIILDLSGSMSRALPSGPSRVEVAKRVLNGLVAETLPEGTPFALRMYGHIRPNSCDTRLDMPLAPLDRARVQSVVTAAQPQLLSGTPLAASLLEVPADLGESGSGATVILLTDGEESCGGDVEAAVRSLRDAGLEVQLHIISFDIASDEAKAQFANWAELGGGRFFDANDEQGLSSALIAALEPAFDVVDATGTVVATGTVGGEPVSVPPGIYSVRLAGSEEGFDDVRVRGDDEQMLLLGGEGQ